jgi:hypothetical protein
MHLPSSSRTTTRRKAGGGVALLGIVDFQGHSLIAEHLVIDTVDRTRVAPLDAQPALGADEEEGARGEQPVQLREVHVAAVHQVKRPGFGHQFV